MFGVLIAVEFDVLFGRKTSVSDVAEITLPVCAWSPMTGERIRTRDPAGIGQLLGVFCAEASVGTISAAVYNVRMKRMSPPIFARPPDIGGHERRPRIDRIK
jgi:hypothetical protein